MKPNITAIRQRAKLLRDLRTFFDSREFLEVQPPCLSRDCVIDPHIDPIPVPSAELQIAWHPLPSEFFLQTSPELAMKRMLAAGAPSIYSIGPVFRAGECGRMHNPEFTMLEWYDVGANLDSGIDLLGRLAAQILGSDDWDVCTYRESFQQVIGLDPIDSSLADLSREVLKCEPTLDGRVGDDRDALLDLLMSARIQPTLGRDRPMIVKNYPLSQAALARAADEDPECAARFELFADGVELANGYDELRDPEILVQRAETTNAKRRLRGGRPLAVETSLTEAMRDGLPACVGVAVGVDRLLMVQLTATAIGEVMPLTIERA